jgi:hypothetical protein
LTTGCSTGRSVAESVLIPIRPNISATLTAPFATQSRPE